MKKASTDMCEAVFALETARAYLFCAMNNLYSEDKERIRSAKDRIDETIFLIEGVAHNV